MRALSTLHRRRQQRGISFIGLLLICVVLACVGVVIAQVVPTVIEYQSILKAAKKAAADGTTVPEIRASFDRAQATDYFTSVSGKDLDIHKDGEKIVVSFAYDKEIPLFGPAYLVIKYKGQTS